MNKRMVKILFFSVVGIFLLLVAANKFVCSPSGLAPEFKEIKETKITNFNSDSISVTIIASAENKNDFEIEIEDLFVNIIYQNDTLGFASRKDKWEIESLQTGDIKFSSVLNTKKVLKIISDDQDSLQLNLIGTAKADLGIIILPVNVDLSFVIPVKEQVAKSVRQDTEDDKIITINSAGLKSLGVGKSVVEIDFEISNPYGIEFSVKDYPSKIFINGKEAGEGNVEEAITVFQKGNTSGGSINYKLSNTKTFTSLFGSLLTGKIEYETSGDLTIEILGFNIQFPYKSKGVLIKI